MVMTTSTPSCICITEGKVGGGDLGMMRAKTSSSLCMNKNKMRGDLCVVNVS